MIYYYGGAFDPPTMAHIKIAQAVKEMCKNGDKLIVGVSSNNEKNYIASAFDRYDMAKIAFEDIADSIVEQRERMYNFLKCFKEDVTIVLGYDEWKDLTSENSRWEYPKALIGEYRFVVFMRSGESLREATLDGERAKFDDIPEEVVVVNFKQNLLDENLHVSSSYVRKMIYNGCTVKALDKFIYSRVLDYIMENRLYDSRNKDEEAEFIDGYNIAAFDQPSVTATIAVISGFTYKDRKILLIRRGGHPYKGCWALPGGFFDPRSDESIMHTAIRELKEEVGIDIEPSPNYITLLKYYDAKNLDPRGRIIDFAFRVSGAKVDEAVAGDDAESLKWFNVNDLPVNIAFHHRDIIKRAL